ncbi:hypothetical protein GYMLUDRAFT_706710 [Collybiopsis luxurians FD-317 M1]|uniref:Uncharacterized protein n=1 Tax=Collybiopsis luxurians FD-317 M1 TaxID=944289 RepID=A0A0D0C6G4_9AGAR|nr:hypothetical protein GYMLUDRAFT_706710 [Collybiopsis luxurians FD-317 M1]
METVKDKEPLVFRRSWIENPQTRRAGGAIRAAGQVILGELYPSETNQKRFCSMIFLVRRHAKVLLCHFEERRVYRAERLGFTSIVSRCRLHPKDEFLVCTTSELEQQPQPSFDIQSLTSIGTFLYLRWVLISHPQSDAFVEPPRDVSRGHSSKG